MKAAYIFTAVAVVLPYLALSFVWLDMNVANWSTADRAMLVILTFFAVYCAAFLGHFVDELHK